MTPHPHLPLKMSTLVLMSNPNVDSFLHLHMQWHVQFHHLASVLLREKDDEPAPPLFRFRPLSSTRSIASSSSSALSSMLKLSFSVFWLLPFLSILTSSPTMHVSMLLLLSQPPHRVPTCVPADRHAHASFPTCHESTTTTTLNWRTPFLKLTRFEDVPDHSNVTKSCHLLFVFHFLTCAGICLNFD